MGPAVDLLPMQIFTLDITKLLQPIAQAIDLGLESNVAPLHHDHDMKSTRYWGRTYVPIPSSPPIRVKPYGKMTSSYKRG